VAITYQICFNSTVCVLR